MSEGRGFQGFICPKEHGNVRLDYCVSKCQDHCYPLPLLLSLGSYREVKDRHFSVTEILRPYQQMFLMRNNPVWINPDDSIWMTFGTGWHEAVSPSKELLASFGIDGDYQIEKTFQFQYKDIMVSGRPDLYIVPQKSLWDYKTAKAYKVKLLKNINNMEKWYDENYFWQVNLYRRWGYPDAKRAWLACLVKDWSAEVARRDKLKPLEIIEVPILRDSAVDEWAHRRLDTIIAIEEEHMPVPPCTTAERWVAKDGKARRCGDYCAVNDICPQFKK